MACSTSTLQNTEYGRKSRTLQRRGFLKLHETHHKSLWKSLEKVAVKLKKSYRKNSMNILNVSNDMIACPPDEIVSSTHWLRQGSQERFLICTIFVVIWMKLATKRYYVTRFQHFSQIYTRIWNRWAWDSYQAAQKLLKCSFCTFQNCTAYVAHVPASSSPVCGDGTFPKRTKRRKLERAVASSLFHGSNGRRFNTAMVKIVGTLLSSFPQTTFQIGSHRVRVLSNCQAEKSII